MNENETEKPFSCNISGCKMSFTNADHLQSHQKKHNMMLNLDVGVKCMETDQTPTPTRFIRNCEEVGLFQDLQNVNPFEETFKKALNGEHTHKIVNLDNAEDTTLHTPNIILCHEENSSKIRKWHDGIDINHLNLTQVDVKNKTPEIQTKVAILINDEHVTCKDKLKEKLINKQQQNKQQTSVIQLTPAKRKTNETVAPPPPSKKSVDTKEKEKIREINRAAQNRCRKKKKIEHNNLVSAFELLKTQNATLVKENEFLHEKVVSLEKLIIKLLSEKNNTPS